MANKVVETVNRDERVELVMRQWNAHQEWLGKGYGPGLNTLRAMAEAAVIGLFGPRTWHPGNVIPDGVTVRDSRGLRWHRDVLGNGTQVRVCNVPIDRFQELVGTVDEVTGWEDSEDRQAEEAPRDKAWLGSTPWGWNPAACRGCGALPGDAHQDRCPNRQPTGEPGEGKVAVRGPLVCQAKHPEDDRVTCQVHHHPASRHPWRHSNFDQAISWLEENPPDHGEQEAPEAPATVAITQEAVTGLVDLLHQAAVKFTRLNTAYKGSATKGANTLAAECEQASQLLQSVIDGKETKE